MPEVIGEDQVTRRHAEFGQERLLATVFGQVSVCRIGYRAKGAHSRYPADAALNLPAGKYSHGLRRLVAQAAAQGSFEHAQAAVQTATGLTIGKRQVEALAAAAAADIDAFYAQRQVPGCPHGDVLVLTADAKGIVMRPEALRSATAKTATSAKLSTRLSKGEKRGRKRMAEVVAVYHATPIPRDPADVIGPPGAERSGRRAGPKAAGKWLHASVTDEAATVITAMFDQADRRDPAGARPWIALVDGNTHQIETIRAQARTRGRPVTIVVDFVHVLEYVCKSGLVPARRSRPGRRNLGRRPCQHHPFRTGHPRGWCAATPGSRHRHDIPATPRHPRVRDLPAQQGPLHALRPGTGRRLAHRHRRHRRRLPAPGKGPHGFDRSPLGTSRRRSHPQTTCPEKQRRLSYLLDLPPRPGETTHPRQPLRRFRHHQMIFPPEEPHPIV